MNDVATFLHDNPFVVLVIALLIAGWLALELGRRGFMTGLWKMWMSDEYRKKGY